MNAAVFRIKPESPPVSLSSDGEHTPTSPSPPPLSSNAPSFSISTLPLPAFTNPSFFLLSQAHRIITQVLITGSRVFGRAFAEAWRQAAASQKYAAAAASGSGRGGAHTLASSGLTLDEACRILNVAPPRRGGEANLDAMTERFKKLFDQNDPKKGGSFYLQSKILRARERIELEVREARREAEREREINEGWRPKVYKDR
ncbi:MAG: mitochondrial import inner membrane translocase subunit TIM16 [Bathelium mastoideum]|nr:MAG: mitochondrial import inner membrane translocase subunit TIM16 [Bathelium mastoideum]KAI9689989.1 MAG: mitochondrial import inner membrane translocase subunit TIM16 [Bathelium mastoideum]